MAILKASNLTLTEGQPETRLTVAVAAAAGTITVESISGFIVGKYVLFGEWGEESAEIVATHASTAPTGTTVTLAANTVRAHAIGTKVTLMDYDQVEFSRSATSGGAKSVTATVACSADNQYTSYTELTNTEAYWYFRFKDSVGTTYTNYSGEFLLAGLGANSVEQMKQDALNITNEKVSDLVTEDFLLRELNNFQREVQRSHNWSWETTTTTQTVVAGQRAYSLPTDTKQPHTPRSIVQIRLKDQYALTLLDKRGYDEQMYSLNSTTLAANVLTTDTTITLTDSSDFASSGSITIGSDDITYTANDTTTNILTVTTATIGSTHTSGDTVWQTQALDQPTHFAVWEDKWYPYPVASSTENGWSIYIDHYKNLSDLTGDTDTTEIPFYFIAQYWLAWKIEIRKGNQQQGDYWKNIYEQRLMAEIRRDKPVANFRFTLAKPIGG